MFGFGKQQTVKPLTTDDVARSIDKDCDAALAQCETIEQAQAVEAERERLHQDLLQSVFSHHTQGYR
jgi:hypothetical protein